MFYASLTRTGLGVIFLPWRHGKHSLLIGGFYRALGYGVSFLLFQKMGTWLASSRNPDSSLIYGARTGWLVATPFILFGFYALREMIIGLREGEQIKKQTFESIYQGSFERLVPAIEKVVGADRPESVRKIGDDVATFMARDIAGNNDRPHDHDRLFHFFIRKFPESELRDFPKEVLVSLLAVCGFETNEAMAEHQRGLSIDWNDPR